MNAPRGHNETAVRLAALAGDAQVALDKVARGEAEALDGWLAYGAALNEGRSLFAGDKEFGQWVEANALSQLATGEVNRDERAAAMWAAANADQFAEARAAGNARTVRGIHAKWKEIEAEREKAKRDAELRQKAEEEKRAREEAAEVARKEAEEKRAAEEDARRAVAEAKDEEERRAAAAKVEEAAEAAQKAEAAAQVAGAAAEVAETPDEAPDPRAAVRKELSGFTREALEDEVVGLRDENKELRAKARKQTHQIAELKARLKEFTGDKDDAIRRLQAEVKHYRENMFRVNANAENYLKQTNKLKKRVAQLQKQLEAQEIPL